MELATTVARVKCDEGADWGESRALEEPVMSDQRPTYVPQLEERRHLVDDVQAEHIWEPWEGSVEWNAPHGEPEEWDLRITDAVAPGPHGDVPVKVYHPVAERADRPCLVWFHGGAFSAGDLEMPEAHEVARGIAGRADGVVVSVDYRLVPVAPEFGGPEPQPGDVRFPVPHDDAHAAFLWARGCASELGVDAARISVGGASAGGNLAAGVALRLRDEGEPPHRAILIYPVLHPVLDLETDAQWADVSLAPRIFQFPPERQLEMNTNYLGGPDVEPTPYAFAGIAESLEGYPPTYIEAAQYDTLRASAERFASDLEVAGVEVEFRIVEGVPHGHLNRVGFAETYRSLEEMARRL